jgi:hypothetical protein
MRRIKLFESFSDPKITEEEVRGPLVELVDVGYDVLVTKIGYGYNVTITAGYELFDIFNVSEPILELIAYLEEKFVDSFVYSIEYVDVNTGIEEEIEDLEQFIKDNPFEDTYEVIIRLRVSTDSHLLF